MFIQRENVTIIIHEIQEKKKEHVHIDLLVENDY